MPRTCDFNSLAGLYPAKVGPYTVKLSRERTCSLLSATEKLEEIGRADLGGGRLDLEGDGLGIGIRDGEGALDMGGKGSCAGNEVLSPVTLARRDCNRRTVKAQGVAGIQNDRHGEDEGRGNELSCE